MRRKNGFSLVELLIVLAVIAALIAVVTPIALNAIAKAKATQVAENLKVIGGAIENSIYVDGVSDITTGQDLTLSNFVKDVQDGYTAQVNTTATLGQYTVSVSGPGTDEVNTTSVGEILGTSNYATSTGIYSFTIVVY
jgi:general secretion pathway protein G